MRQLIYTSVYNSGRVDSTLTALREIVKVSQRNNARDGLTGYLVFDGKGFLQILEGEEPALDRAYARIEDDPRHRDCKIIGTREVSKRSFGAWSMAGYLRRPDETALFERHHIRGPIAEASLTVEQAFALAEDLASATPAAVA